MKDDLLDRPDLATAEVVLHDLHRGSTEGDIEGVVDAKDSVLETAVRFEASDPESLNLLERLYPNRPAMGPKAVIGGLGAKILGYLAGTLRPLCIGHTCVRMDELALKPPSHNVLRQLDDLGAEVQQPSGIATQDRRPGGDGVDVRAISAYLNWGLRQVRR